VVIFPFEELQRILKGEKLNSKAKEEKISNLLIKRKLFMEYGLSADKVNEMNYQEVLLMMRLDKAINEKRAQEEFEFKARGGN